MDGADTGETGVDNDFIVAGDAGIGATIMGRNMFGAGERLCEDLGTLPGYEISAAVRSPGVTHVTFTKST
ncbi:hypothetical protein AB0L63_12235 [Nocardia sp. NPDC051990]|uniref:hypothetical protein n=1 Tax=Nocardia sp. NPDC051990 TaxID=3155285 RepID=UPI0034205F55